MKQTIAVLLFLLNFTPGIILAQQISQSFVTDCGFEGSITLYDSKNDRWLFSDSADAMIQMLPASSFKILNSLIVLEEGVVKDENEKLKWDGRDRGFEDWNRDLSVKEAFRVSAAWVYQKLALKIPAEKYKYYLEQCEYGNKNTGRYIDSFWLDGSLKVSPVEQISFLKRLKTGDLPFSPETIAKVREIMIAAEAPGYVLRGKTGWGRVDGRDTGWWVGYIETADNTVWFATRLKKDTDNKNPDFPGCRKSITEKVLTALGYIPSLSEGSGKK